MTAYEVVEILANYLKARFDSLDELVDSKKPINTYVGYLPIPNSNSESEALLPAVVLRPVTINEDNDSAIVSIAILVSTYDRDKKEGCKSVYHLTELVRQELLKNNPVLNKCRIKDNKLDTTYPDEQPYPQWLARIDLEIYIPKVKATLEDFWTQNGT